MTSMTPLDLARQYISLGWAPVPIARRKKGPSLQRWQNLRLTDEAAPRHFGAAPQNIGIILGEASRWLVDVDLDCAEAVELAPSVLPETTTFGRESKRQSHWLYIAEGAESERFVIPRRAPVPATTLVELRSTGGQTVFPGSVHPSGEPIEWTEGAPTMPAAMPAADLRAAAARLAVAALFRRTAPARLDAFLATGSLDGLLAVDRDLAERWLQFPAAPRPAAPRPPRKRGPDLDVYSEAVQRYNADHGRDWGRSGGSACPLNHSPSDHQNFGRCHDSDARWACFSSNHPHDVGRLVEGSTPCYVGDALDIDAGLAGRSPRDHLIAEGYYRPTTRREEPPHPAESVRDMIWPRQPSGPEPAPLPAPSTPIVCAPVEDVHLANDTPGPAAVLAEALDALPASPPPSGPRPDVEIVYRVGYAGMCDVIRSPFFATRCCDGAEIEWNEMSNAVDLGREPLTDARLNAALERVQHVFQIETKKGLIDYVPKIEDARRAIDQIAHERPYHPVAEYLRGLQWDGVPRVDYVASEILGIAEPTPIVRVMLRRWFIGAARRVLDPGSKFESALILVGKQGVKKTTFFEVLARKDEWYLSYDDELNTRDAMQLLNGAWIVEMAELSSLRGKDVNKFKGFASKRSDKWIAKYDRFATFVKRRFVVVGTTNDEAILDDPTGARRHWIVETGHSIDCDRLRATADQLWAEAVRMHEAGEKSFLEPEEEEALKTEQEAFQYVDPWERLISEWAAAVRTGLEQGPVTCSRALECAVKKPAGQWTRADQMRVAAILKGLGMKRTQVMRAGAKSWIYV